MPLVPRIAVVSPDQRFATTLADALAPVATTVVTAGAADPVPDAELHVVHVVDVAASLAELAAGFAERRVVAVLPARDLAAATQLLRASDAVVAVAVAASLEPQRLRALVASITVEDGPGPSLLLAPETAEPRSTYVVDHEAKLRCLAEVASAAKHAGGTPNDHAAIEQCLDELVTNALYAAPVGAQGERLFATVSPQARTALCTQYAVLVQYAGAGKRFALSVCDVFGSLNRATALRVLDKCLHDGAPVDRKVGGAGLGLYLLVNLATAVHFHVQPGVATRVLCAFDLDTAGAGSELAFVVRRTTAEHPATAPARRRRTARARRWLAVRAAAAVALAALIGAAGWRVARSGLSPVATLELASDPRGAMITVDGVQVGTTPLAVTSLAPRSRVTIGFVLRGYTTATVTVTVPERGQKQRIEQPLAQSPELVRVRFISDPPGAAIVPTGQLPSADRTYTPAELFLEAGRLQRFTLIMPKHAPFVIEPFTPARGAQDAVVGGALVESDR